MLLPGQVYHKYIVTEWLNIIMFVSGQHQKSCMPIRIDDLNYCQCCNCPWRFYLGYYDQKVKDARRHRQTVTWREMMMMNCLGVQQYNRTNSAAYMTRGLQTIVVVTIDRRTEKDEQRGRQDKKTESLNRAIIFIVVFVIFLFVQSFVFLVS